MQRQSVFRITGIVSWGLAGVFLSIGMRQWRESSELSAAFQERVAASRPAVEEYHAETEALLGFLGMPTKPPPSDEQTQEQVKRELDRFILELEAPAMLSEMNSGRSKARTLFGLAGLLVVVGGAAQFISKADRWRWIPAREQVLRSGPSDPDKGQADKRASC